MDTRDWLDAMQHCGRLLVGVVALVGACLGVARGWRALTLALVGNAMLVGGFAGLMREGALPGGAALAGQMTDGAVLLMMAAGVCAVVGWARGRGDKNAERATAGKQTQ